MTLLWTFLLGRLAALLAFFGLKARLRKEGREEVRAEIVKSTLRAVRKADEVENEVEALDHDTLKRRASRWVRGTDK